MSGNTLRWVLGGTIVLVLSIVAWAFIPTGPSGPPPPTPLPRSILEKAAPATPVVETHVSPEVPSDMKERRDFRQSAPHVAERKPPALRFNDPGIAPWQLVTRHTRPGMQHGHPGHTAIDATYEGKKVPAHVVVDGVYRGDSPLELELPEGDHLVRLDYAGTRVNQFMLHVEGGGAETDDVTLRRPDQVGRNPDAKGSKGYHE